MKRDLIYLAIGVVAALGFKACYDNEREAHGETKFRLQTLARERAELADSFAKLEFTHKTDTIRLTKVEKERVPVIQKVTEFIDRNIPVPVEVVKEVIKADSAVIQACHQVIDTCEQQKAVLLTDLGKANEQIKLLKRPKGFFQTVWEWLSKIGIGYLLHGVLNG